MTREEGAQAFTSLLLALGNFSCNLPVTEARLCTLSSSCVFFFILFKQGSPYFKSTISEKKKKVSLGIALKLDINGTVDQGHLKHKFFLGWEIKLSL